MTESGDSAYSASMGQEVRADGLQVSLCGGRQSANSREILLGAPALRKGWQSNINDLRSHCDNSKRRNIRNFEKGRRGGEMRSKLCAADDRQQRKTKGDFIFSAPTSRSTLDQWRSGSFGGHRRYRRRSKNRTSISSSIIYISYFNLVLNHLILDILEREPFLLSQERTENGP
jgi:hypothetical protein